MIKGLNYWVYPFALSQISDHWTQTRFLISSVSKQKSKSSSIDFLLTFSQSSDHKAQGKIFCLLCHKEVITKLSYQFWSALPQSSDHRAQGLDCLPCLKEVISELRKDFWSALSHKRNQRDQSSIDFLLTFSQSSDHKAQQSLLISSLSHCSDHRAQGLIFCLLCHKEVISELRKELNQSFRSLSDLWSQSSSKWTLDLIYVRLGKIQRIS